ncbi:hypothetical protein Syun_020983 [Stephania yunnanensis]|uniref:DUF4005 domain-containing protein n=1 Tax=Stephania yunnanensis TaxID=152371 RepID=A0AAP0IEX2_9MAGN
MGKSPGKWIKSVLFGKKASRSGLLKGQYTSSKAGKEKETRISAKEPSADLPADPPLVSDLTAGHVVRNGGNLVPNNGATTNLSHEGDALVPDIQDAQKQLTDEFGAPDDPNRIRLEEAATKVQATFRGYLARRAFRALRGIIRLQALIRGHLVRRQAVATLRCMQSIVRFQALVRGHRLKLSDARCGGHGKNQIRKPQDTKSLSFGKANAPSLTDKLQANAFVRKLLRSSPSAKPLRLQYALEEPNSAWNWLERWSSSRFWPPLRPAKKNADLKAQTRPGGSRNAETEPSRSKRIIRRGSTSHVDNGSTSFNSETEKPRRNLRKVASHPVEQGQEHSPNEFEKAKRNLRKVSNPMVESTDRLEVEAEKPRRSLRKASTSPVTANADKGAFESFEKVKDMTVETLEITKDTRVKPSENMEDIEVRSSEKMKDVAVEVAKELDTEDSLPTKHLTVEVPVDVMHEDEAVVELPFAESVEKEKSTSVANGGLLSKEDNTGNENHKTSRRRSSLSGKQENQENGLQKTPTLPSYMATTESAKAKLRGQCSPRFGQEGVENNGFTRRHSLPSSANGKLSSVSPRTQRPVQASGKVIKNDRSLLSSRDGSEKLIQAEWRR